MNTAVVDIGLRNAGLETKAITAARRISEVEVDHGRAACRTPDAIAYIDKAKAHRARGKARS